MARKLLQVWLEADFLERVDNWRHAHRFAARTQAVRELLERGMADRKEVQRTQAKPEPA